MLEIIFWVDGLYSSLSTPLGLKTVASFTLENKYLISKVIVKQVLLTLCILQIPSKLYCCNNNAVKIAFVWGYHNKNLPSVCHFE